MLRLNLSFHQPTGNNKASGLPASLREQAPFHEYISLTDSLTLNDETNLIKLSRLHMFRPVGKAMSASWRLCLKQLPMRDSFASWHMEPFTSRRLLRALNWSLDIHSRNDLCGETRKNGKARHGTHLNMERRSTRPGASISLSTELPQCQTQPIPRPSAISLPNATPNEAILPFRSLLPL